jgi:hypothetical protein
VGLRVAYGFPLGSVSRKDTLSSNLTGMLPVWLDAGYRVSRQFYVGAYFQWAPAFVADDLCPKNLSCTGYDLRAGANVHWHFKWLVRDGSWAGAFDPWVGLGTGYEGALLHFETLAGARSKETFHAFEYANLQVGADYFGAPWHVGAFFGLSLAEYLSVTQTNPNGSTTFAIPDPALHLWLSLGLKGQYDL